MTEVERGVNTTVYVRLPLQWAYTRHVAQGVREYGRHRRDWRLVWVWPESKVLPASSGKRGIITMIRTPTERRTVAAWGIPAVNVSGHLARSPMGRVTSDHRAIGRMAAEHLIGRGYRCILFVGDSSLHYSRERWAGVREAVRLVGLKTVAVEIADVWKRPRTLACVKPPVGIVLHLDDPAADVMHACRHIGWEIPREAAIVGVNNDDVFCDLTPVPLSSVDPDAPRVGHEAAVLLDRLLRGARVSAKETLVPPRGVVVRESSDYFAVEDRALAAAAAYIRDHACDPMAVRDIPRQVGVCRRTLEMRFRAHFGRTLHDEIRRVQIERAKQLLISTHLPVTEVGERSGFKYVNRFSVIFRSETGQPPGAFRARHAVHR